MRRVLALALVVCLLLSGLPAVSAQENATKTSTPTPETATETPTQAGDSNDSSSDNGPGNGVQAVEVYVEQPRYIDNTVSHSQSAGLHTYTVRGEVHELEPDGINASQVVRSGVREDSATLKYDKGIQRWILNSQGTAGTYRVFWVVREESGTTTYAANIQIKQAAYKHVNPSQYEDLNAKASNWDWTVSEFESAGLLSSSAGVEQAKSVISDAVTWYEFYTSPFQALQGQFLSIGIMLIRWPAGWIIIGSLLLLFFIRDRKKTKQNRRYKRQFAKIEDVDEAERRAEERELKRFLSMQTFTDLGLTESDAEAIKEHCNADNPRQFLERLRNYLSEQRMVSLLLDAHAQVGHTVRVRRDDAGDIAAVSLCDEPLPGEENLVADGGADTDADVEAGGIQYLDPAEAGDDIILSLDWTDMDPTILWDERIDTRDLSFPIANDADAEDDLVASFDIPIGEDGHEYHILERREEFAELLLTFIQQVAASEYTDDEGRPRPDADMLDFLYTFTSVSAEKYRWPLYHTRDILMRCRQQLDANDRMRDVADRSQQGDL